jgi:hypothetical protein
MREKFITKVKLPIEDTFEINDSFIKNSIGLKRTEFKEEKVYFSDNFIFIEYEKISSTPPNSGFIKR